MAWLQDDTEENEFSQFEEEDGEGAIEEIDEEVIVTERPGSASTPVPAVSKRKPRTAKKAKARSASRVKPRPKKKKAAKKPAAKSRTASRGGKRSKARRRR